MKKIIISIITYNGHDATLNCLTSIAKSNLSHLDVSVVVIDNASKTVFALPDEFHRTFPVQIIRTAENLGFSGGQNVGISYALEREADYVVILNNDTLVDKKWLQEMVRAADSNKHYGIIAPKIYFAPGHEFHKSRYQPKDLGKVFWYAGGIIDWNNVIGSHRGVDEIDRGQYNTLEETSFATGCCMLVRREVFEKVGVFDERYFLYFEDSDLNERVKSRYKIIYAPDAVIWHENAGSTGGSGSLLQDYYTTRNRLLFGFSYAPLKTKQALFRESMRMLVSGRLWQKKGVRDYYLKKFGKGSYHP